MTHQPIYVNSLELIFPHKTCFENFSCQIYGGERIGIIGKNGSGKSSLLKMIANIKQPDLTLAYVPQIIVAEDLQTLSGAERFQKELSKALSVCPDVLLLDEPTNHLDVGNKKQLMRMLQHFAGTLIIVSHDKGLLRQCTDTLWHIDQGKINIFKGQYDDYMRHIQQQRASLENELSLLSRHKKEMHNKLMQEQERASKSKAKGAKNVANKKWLKSTADLKGMKAEKSQGKKMRAIDDAKQDLNERLATLHLPEMITPRFHFQSAQTHKHTLVHINNGTVGYADEITPILSNVNLALQATDRLVITGNNGSGKSTLIKAILNAEHMIKTGDWVCPASRDIGYLDQHYNTLLPEQTVFEHISSLVPHWPHNEVRCHLNDFLFRKNEEVNSKACTLSGGEKARLCLSQIAVCAPSLLILDEITNNLDIETKEHVIQVLKAYPGALLMISHDDEFVQQIGATEVIDVEKFKIQHIFL